VEQKIFDPFIKGLLRNYEGIFDRYVNINEFYLARIFKAEVELIRNYLKHLHNYGIIDYKPFIRSNFIFFPHGRLPEKDIVFSKENYRWLKQRYIDNIEAMINYAENSKQCRSQFILGYFGEENPPVCRKCDICRKNEQANK